MNELNPNFANSNCGIMRHGVYNPKSQAILSFSEDHCREVIGRLVSKINAKRFRVFFSPTIRTKNTADIVCDELVRHGATIESMEESNWLNCGKRQITHQITTLSPEDDIFILLISHQPDIEHFLKRERNAKNCKIFSRDFTIE